MGYSCGYHLYPLVGSISCRPPRVRAITFISQPPHLLYGVRVALDFFLRCRVVRPKSALYEVSVRRPETLPVLALLSLHIRLPSDPTSRWAPLPLASKMGIQYYWTPHKDNSYSFSLFLLEDVRFKFKVVPHLFVVL